MTILLSEEARASAETQRDSPSVKTSVAEILLANSIRALAMDAVQVARRESAVSGRSTRARSMMRAAIGGIDRFGESAPASVLFKHFGFTVEHFVTPVKRVIAP